MNMDDTQKIVELIERLAKAYDIATTPRVGKSISTYDMNEMERAINRLSGMVAPKEAN